MNEKTNGIIEAMMDESINEVASKGVKGVSQKTLTMACHKLMTDQLKNQRSDIRKYMRPVWWLAAAVGAGIIWQVISITIFT